MALIQVSCARCKERFGLEEATYATLKRSSREFYCPWGHTNFYPQGPTETEKLRDEVKRLEDRTRQLRVEADSYAEEAASAERRASAARGQVTKIKNRVGRGVCPCCNRSFQNLAGHMAGQHPDWSATL